MKPLLELKDEDIFPDTLSYEIDDSWHERNAVKMILLDDDDNIALVGIGCFLLPGGGVEEGETLEDAVLRECLEEVGCHVEILEKVGITKETRLQRKGTQITHCFVVRLVGEKGEPTTTQEDELDMEVRWYSLEDALKLLIAQKKIISLKRYHSQFNVRTHRVFLETYMNIKNT